MYVQGIIHRPRRLTRTSASIFRSHLPPCTLAYLLSPPPIALHAQILYDSACPVHWIVNYELEKRFEEARVKLRETMGCEPEEKQLFHGTSAENIDS